MSKKSSPTKMLKQLMLSVLILSLFWLLTQLLEQFPSHPLKLPSATAPIEFYSNQTDDDLSQLYQQAIASAKDSIVLAIYSLKDDLMIEALKTKCDEGASVHIVCDAEASRGISKRLPDAVLIRRFGDGLMHQKILVVDNHLIWLGSANFTFSSLNIHDNLVLGLDHPALADMLIKRITSMDEEGAFTPLTHQETQINTQNLEIWVLPDDPAAAKRLVQLFRGAQKSIRVAMFTWTRNDFTQELIAAAQRGVKVEAVVDRNSGKGMGAKIIRMMANKGIPVAFTTGPGLLHHKFAYIDDTILVHGSANWTQRAFTENDDYFVVIYPLTSQQQAKMNQLYQAITKQSKIAIQKNANKAK